MEKRLSVLSENKNKVIPLFILHWNCADACLETIKLFQEQNCPTNIIVIDNSSDIDHLSKLKEGLDSSSVSLIELNENRGWGGGFNTVLRDWLLEEEGSPYCFVCAHDALPEKDCLNMLVNAMQSDIKLGIVCPEYGGVSFIPRYSPVRCSYFQYVKERPKGTVEYVDIPHGTLMLYRKECLLETGLYDERYFAYGDEYDLGLRARKKGWKIGLVWGAIVHNPDSWTPSFIRQYLISRNSLLLAKVHGSTCEAVLRSFLLLMNSFRHLLISRHFNGYISREKWTYFQARMFAIKDFFSNQYKLPKTRILSNK